MKKIIVSMLCVSALSACFHEIETPEPVIDHPPLSLQANFEELQKTDEALTMTAESSKQLLSDVIYHFMNSAETANQMADVVAVSDYFQPVKFNVSNAVYVENASTKFCKKVDDETANVEASIWDDRDNSQTVSAGDIWYYRLQNCQSEINSAIVTGLIKQEGIADQFLPDANDIVNFEHYIYTLDMQIDPQNGNIAYLKNTRLDYSRFNEVNTTMSISPNSLMGVVHNDTQAETETAYLFEFRSGNVEQDDDNDTLTVSFAARYYQTDTGYVDVIADGLVFDYSYKTSDSVTWAENNPFETISLSAGTLTINSENETAILEVDSDSTKISTTFNNDSATTETADQVVYFRTSLDVDNQASSTFSLVNISD